jgi:hypothetical protein
MAGSRAAIPLTPARASGLGLAHPVAHGTRQLGAAGRAPCCRGAPAAGESSTQRACIRARGDSRQPFLQDLLHLLRA